MFTGALTHYEDSTTGTYTHLLDFTGATTSFADPALTGTWSDPYSNLSLSVGGVTPSALTLNVNYGPVPCTVVQPAVSISPANPTAYSGTNVNQTLSITNNDTGGCSAITLVPSSSLPLGWLTTFNPTTLTLSPGQTGSLTMTKSVPAGLTPGTYAVNATLADAGTHSATAAANVTVTEPPQPIQVTTSVTPTSVKAKDTVAIVATVTKVAGGAAAGASVTFTVNRPGGTVTQTVVANASASRPGATKHSRKASTT